MNHKEHYELSYQKRQDFWKSKGKVFPDVIGALINPAFLGGPKWPNLRQAYLGIDAPESTIIATDGLSDPYDDYDRNPANQAYNGLGLELYIVSANKFDSVESIIKSWEFSVLRRIAHNAASNPNLINMLMDYKYVSTDIAGEGLPESLNDEKENTGVLLGLENKNIPGKLELTIETISIVNVTPLKPNELDYIMKNGAQGRIKLAEMLQEQGCGEVAQHDRPSVI